MSNHFIKDGNIFTIAPAGALDIHPHLPVGTYIVKFNSQKAMFYLEETEPFGKIPGKVYGDTTANADRIINTYINRTASTGVLLSGEKGSGKTMMAKLLSVKAAENGWPTIIINTPFYGDTFNKFIQDINQRCLVLFDEFEKVYYGNDDDSGENKQEQLLTLLDGVYPQQKLFVLTCNYVSRIDDHMMNRPGRIYYFLEYEGLHVEFIREYLNDNLNDKTQIESFVAAVKSLFDRFNFDMMKAMVEEMNRYNETVGEVMKFINARPSYSDDVKYTLTITPIGNSPKLSKDDGPRGAERILAGNPLASSHDIYFSVVGQDHNEYVELTPTLLIDINPKEGTYTYSNGEYEFFLKRKPDEFVYDYMKVF